MLHGCEMPRVTTDTRIRWPSAVGYSTGLSGIGGIGISGATGMPFANGTCCWAWLGPAAATASAAKLAHRRRHRSGVIGLLVIEKASHNPSTTAKRAAFGPAAATGGCQNRRL